MQILAIDPGSRESAYVVWDGTTLISFEKMKNEDLKHKLIFLGGASYARIVIEQIACYGKAVGEDVFETVFWAGIFAQCCEKYDRMKRGQVKMHLCGSMRVKDSNIITALVDRFDRERIYGKYGKGTKKNPGPFFGFSKDVWQAFALAVTYFDLRGSQK